MPKAFVSCSEIAGPVGQSMVQLLKRMGFEVAATPKPSDAAWQGWCQGGFNQAMEGVEVFVIAMTETWEGNTVMMYEAYAALKLQQAGTLKRHAWWNPKKVAIRNAAMKAYLLEALPERIEDVQTALSAPPKPA